MAETSAKATYVQEACDKYLFVYRLKNAKYTSGKVGIKRCFFIERWQFWFLREVKDAIIL